MQIVTEKLRTTVRHAGQFRCTRCENYSKAAFEYFCLLMFLVCSNVFLIWRSLQDLDDITGWNKPQGSDYVQVRVVKGGLCDAVMGCC